MRVDDKLLRVESHIEVPGDLIVVVAQVERIVRLRACGFSQAD